MPQQFKPGVKQGTGFSGVDELRQGFVLHLYEILMEVVHCYEKPSGEAANPSREQLFDNYCRHLRAAIILPETQAELDKEVEIMRERMRKDPSHVYGADEQVMSEGYVTIERVYKFIHKVLELTISDTSGVTSNILEIDLSELGQDFKEKMEKKLKETGDGPGD